MTRSKKVAPTEAAPTPTEPTTEPTAEKAAEPTKVETPAEVAEGSVEPTQAEAPELSEEEVAALVAAAEEAAKSAPVVAEALAEATSAQPDPDPEPEPEPVDVGAIALTPEPKADPEPEPEPDPGPSAPATAVIDPPKQIEADIKPLAIPATVSESAGERLRVTETQVTIRTPRGERVSTEGLFSEPDEGKLVRCNQRLIQHTTQTLYNRPVETVLLPAGAQVSLQTALEIIKVIESEDAGDEPVVAADEA